VATVLLWAALIAAIFAVVAAYTTSAPQFSRVPWVALSLAFFFASLLVGAGYLDLST
jgi:hypothetical protein